MPAGTFSSETVALMRADPASLGDDPAHALRLVLRVVGSFNAMQAQLRARLGLGGNELQALLALWDGGRCPMTDLGARIGLSRPAITTLADRLEAAGLMQRLNDPHDRRRILLAVTPLFESLLFEELEMLDGELSEIAGADAASWKAFASAAAQVRGAARRQGDAMQHLKPVELAKKGDPRPEVVEAHW